MTEPSTSIIPMDASNIELDTAISSPDYDTPTIPEIDSSTQKALDFDTLPTKVCAF